MERMEAKGMCIKLPEFDPEKFRQKSKDELWAKRGLGMTSTAVDGWMEMFSAFLTKLGCDIGPLELERWMDTYYQLRFTAEREADIARFMANNCKVGGVLEPVVPKINKVKVADKETARLAAEAIVKAVFQGRCQFGPEIKDPDEKEEAKPKGCCHGREYCECKGPHGESNR